MPVFLHAADLHLDSPLRGLDRKEGAPAQRIRAASRTAMERMVGAAIERRVTFVLLAGDIYDTQPAFETYLFFHQQMDRLASAGIPVAIVLGNHDHAGVSPRAGRLPAGVQVLPAEQPTSLEIVPGVWVHGQSYPTRDIAYDLSERYPPPVPGALNIGLLHTALDGHSGGHARYAPSSTRRLAAHGYDYWALGHVHQPLVLNEQGCHIVYPGNLQGRHARETGPKGAMWVEFEAAGVSAVRHTAFDDVRWYRIEVPAAGLEGDADPVAQIVERIRSETAFCRAEGRLCAVRLCLGGVAPRALIQLGEAEIHESLLAAFSTDDALFLEKVEIDLQPEVQDRVEVDRHLDSLLIELGQCPEVSEAVQEARQAALGELRRAGGPELVEAFRARESWGAPIGDLSAELPRVRESLLASTRGAR